MKFKVYGSATIGVSIVVDADNEEEAIDKAYEEFSGLRGYVGNGGIDKLVGVSESNVSLDPGEYVEFTDCEASL